MSFFLKVHEQTWNLWVPSNRVKVKVQDGLITLKLQDILDKHTEPWGIKVSLVETKQVDLPENMQRAITRQAEAEREKRTKIIHAEGEYQAAEKLTQAANVISTNPTALQLRFLQTLAEIATEKNSTTIIACATLRDGKDSWKDLA